LILKNAPAAAFVSARAPAEQLWAKRNRSMQSIWIYAKNAGSAEVNVILKQSKLNNEVKYDSTSDDKH
jgi:hypothetical protein